MPDLSPSEMLAMAGAAALNKDSSAEMWGEVVERLGAQMNGAEPLTRQTLRYMLTEHGCPAGIADEIHRAKPNSRPVGQGTRLVLSDPEPWPESVEGQTVLNDLEATFNRFLALADGAATALALWTVHAHAHAAARISPILALTSPEKRCGKTTALAVLSMLVRRPLPVANITAAALFRTVEQYRPTLLVDEADTFIRDRSELRGVLNSGHRRDMAVVIRTVGDDHEARHFSTWCPKAVALIGKLPGTLADRSIEVRMRRRKERESVEPFRADCADDLEPIRRKAWTWATASTESLRMADPDVPAGLNDRAADNWRPLLALAELAGGEWPAKARAAATLLSANVGDDSEGAGVLLLADIRELFERRSTDRLTTKETLAELVRMEERPWPEWYRGNALTARGLAKLLRPFDVRPKTLKVADGSTAKGYMREAFDDAFERYLPPHPPSVSVTPSPWHKSTTNAGSASVTENPVVTDCDSRESAILSDGYGVTDNEPLAPQDAEYERAEREGMGRF